MGRSRIDHSFSPSSRQRNNSMDTIKSPIFASQESALVMQNGYRYFHFYGQISQGKYDTVVKLVKDGDGYDSIEEALKKEIPLKRIPSGDLDKLVLQMISWVNIDFGKGFGVHYPEYKCVAWAGPHNTQKPFVYYVVDGKKKWVTHPQLELLVQYYGE